MPEASYCEKKNKKWILDRKTVEQEDTRISEKKTRKEEILDRRTAEYYTGRQLNIRRRIAKYGTE